MMEEQLIKYLNDCHWSSGRDYEIIKDFIKDFFDKKKQECRFCLDPESILTKTTCCSKCSILKKNLEFYD